MWGGGCGVWGDKDFWYANWTGVGKTKTEEEGKKRDRKRKLNLGEKSSSLIHMVGIHRFPYFPHTRIEKNGRVYKAHIPVDWGEKNRIVQSRLKAVRRTPKIKGGYLKQKRVGAKEQKGSTMKGGIQRRRKQRNKGKG